MDLVQGNRDLIRKLLLFGAPLYFLLGSSRLGINGTQTEYLRYGLISLTLLFFSFALLLKCLRCFPDMPSIVGILASNLSVAGILFLPVEQRNSAPYFISVIVIISACITDSAVIIKKYAYLNLIFIFLQYVYLIISTEYFQDISIAFPILFFIIWRMAVTLKLISTIEGMISEKQLLAYRTTVAVLNHKFNNLNSVCLNLLEKIRVQDLSYQPKLWEFTLIKNSITRLVRVIEHLTSLTEYKELFEPRIEDSDAQRNTNQSNPKFS